LDEDNIKIVIDFKDYINDEIIFSDVLQKKSSSPSKSYHVVVHG